MSVFLRWGIFGVIGIAALMYAYNASKRLAVSHTARPPPASSQPAAPAPGAEQSAPRMPAPDYEGLISRCRAELEVAYLAVMARDDGEPFDRLLRSQKIAWQDDPKVRERLTQVATRWFRHEGPVDPEQMHDAVNLDCLNFKTPS